MKIGLFIPTWRRDYNKISASIWIRCLQQIKFYKKMGVDVDVNNPLKKYDVVIVYRACDEIAYKAICWFKKRSGRVYWDTVVNYYEKHEASDNQKVYWANKISEVVDGVIVSSHELEKRAIKHNNNTFYCPDSIDLNHFNLYKESINYESPVFGWSGISSKAIFLTDHKNYLTNKLIVVSDSKLDIGFQYDFVKWAYHRFPNDVFVCDIGFFPRAVASTYNICHSSFKILPYVIQGIPVIASKIPSYIDVAKLCDHVFFWQEGQCIDDIIAKLSMCTRDVTTVRSEYAAELWAHRLINFVSQESDK